MPKFITITGVECELSGGQLNALHINVEYIVAVADCVDGGDILTEIRYVDGDHVRTSMLAKDVMNLILK